jgi:hypothetical protein
MPPNLTYGWFWLFREYIKRYKFQFFGVTTNKQKKFNFFDSKVSNQGFVYHQKLHL